MFMRKSLILTATSIPTYIYLYRKTYAQREDPLSTFRYSYTTRLYKVARPLLFALFDPETAHRLTLKAFALLGRLPWSTKPSLFPEQAVSVLGVLFPSPIGVAAGFDKNAEALPGLSRLNLGHIEVGSVSALPWEGNPRPRLFRIPEVEGVMNRMGLNNEGVAIVADRIQRYQLATSAESQVPVGVNITKTPDASIVGDAAIHDFVFSFTRLAPHAAWVTLNVSCPNTSEGKTFEQDLGSFVSLIRAVVDKRRELNLNCPIFVKLSPLREGQDESDVLALVAAGVVAGCDGFVLANTVSDRGLDLNLPDYATSLGRGGVSGRVIHERTRRLVKYVAEATSRQVPIIAVGGVSSAEDAWELLTSGASLVQLYTAMVYEGPGVFEDINNGLRRLALQKGGIMPAVDRGIRTVDAVVP